MCGIAGFLGDRLPPNSAIQQTLTWMANRGPDHRDRFDFQTHNQTGTLLHSRLAIIDLDPRSNQPFRLGKATIVFNGEIYNYVELRNQLIEQGVSFRTHSDTEVLLQLYLQHGTDCVDHLEGMWSFAIYDADQKSLFLSRDRFAEKPLYVFENENGFYFGSEVKFLAAMLGKRPSVNQQHVRRFLVNGYKSLYKTDETFFEGVSELKYAENLLIDRDGRRRRWRYWKPEPKVNSNMSLTDAIDGTRHHLLESMKIRLRSDVPLAFCLSGGVDSASLVSIAGKEFNANIETFSIIDSDPRYDERDNILATVADVGCRSHLIETSTDGSLERLKKLIAYHDAPVATISYLIHSMISESVHDAGFKVTFSGTSADELFTGYYDHFNLHLNAMRNHPTHPLLVQQWQEAIGQYVRNPHLKNPDLYAQTPNFRGHVFDASDEIRQFLNEDFEEAFREESFTDDMLRNRMLNEVFHEATPVILHEDDLNSMFYSIENRSPFLDKRLFEFAYSIPAKHLIQKGFGKYVLRMALEGILNDQVRLDKRKKGFNASINSLVDFKDKATRAELLDPDSPVFEIISREKISRLMNEDHLPNHYSKFLFNFINIKYFLEQV